MQTSLLKPHFLESEGLEATGLATLAILQRLGGGVPTATERAKATPRRAKS